MAIEQIKVPDLGDPGKVDVVEVLVANGDQLAVDDAVITLESDKASMDVPSPIAGQVTEIKVKVGDKVGEGDVILLVEAAEATQAPAVAEKEPGDEPAAAADEPEPALLDAPLDVAPRASEPAPPAVPDTAGVLEQAARLKAYASPAVRRFARELGVDLTRVQGSGRKGRILKEDVQGWVKKALVEPAAAAGAAALPEMPVIDFSKFGEIERVPLSRVQKISGPNLRRSWLNVPHVTQHDEADITELEEFRQRYKDEAKVQGFNLTPLAFVLKAAVAALQQFPKVNSSLDPDGESLVLKRYYHLGVAVDTDEGLMVPVVRDVDRKGIFELARELAELSAQTRERKLRPDQVRGASFTVSSLGGIGGTAFTPIVNAPEVAILGVSRAALRPVWRDGGVAPRLMLPVSLSYDHRVVDGALAVRFTTYLCQVLADLRRLLL